MKSPIGCILLFFSIVTINCQSRYDPFLGGLEIGYGISTALNFKTVPIASNIFDMPFHAGFITMKYMNDLKSIEIGLLYGRHTAYYRKLQLNDYTFPLVSINCIDFPLRFFFKSFNSGKRLKRIFCGITSSYLFLPVTYQGDGPHIIDSSYRKIYSSLNAGLSIEGRKSRLKIYPNISFISIYRPEIELDETCEGELCGGKLFPIELMFSYNYLFN